MENFLNQVLKKFFQTNFRRGQSDHGAGRLSRKTRGALFPAGGFLAGLINGVFGTGGSLVVLWLLERFAAERLPDRRDRFAVALLAMLPVTAVTWLLYLRQGNAQTAGIWWFLLPALAGGLLGALLLDRIRLTWLSRVFAGMLTLSGLLLLLR